MSRDAIKRLKELEKDIGNQTKKLQTMGGDLIVGIIKRTQSGRNVDFRPFKPYSPLYKKKNRNVNLTVKGTMLGAITDTKIKNGIKLFFNVKSERGKAHGNQQTRVFFGLDEKQKKTILKELNKQLSMG